MPKLCSSVKLGSPCRALTLVRSHNSMALRRDAFETRHDAKTMLKHADPASLLGARVPAPYDGA